MSGSEMANYRRDLLADVRGDVLEIGFGTGLNLAYYPPHIQRLTAIDANPGMHSIAQQRVKQSSLTVDHRVLNGEQLPMADNSFDSVVSTWTLCSIRNVHQAISEVHRVLKPGGQFFFVEHGLSSNPQVQAWQRRLTPLQRVIADGCHLDRAIHDLVATCFQQITLEHLPCPSLPEVVGYFYKGIATKL